MKKLSLPEFLQLTRDARVLSRDEHGDKVLGTADGTIIKLFRRKRLISSALWRPYALRFARASARLKFLGIRAAEVRAVCTIPSIKRHAVVYPMIPGVTLREAIVDAHRRNQLLGRLAEMFAALHAGGVYFRAAHFGNFLVQPDGALALIDLSEARCKSRPLSLSMRVRNLRPLHAYAEDWDAMKTFGIDEFLRRYVEAANLSPLMRTRFIARAHRTLHQER